MIEQLHERYLKFEKEFRKKIIHLYLKSNWSNLVFLCIGTNKIKGDAIGPIIGNYLKKIENSNVQIYGTIKENLDFSNARKIIEGVYNNYENPFIITIDAALSSKQNKGKIILSDGYIKIGKALNKSLCFYSNMNIKCIIGNNHHQEEENIKELINADMNEVFEMANIVSYGVKNVLKNSNIYV